MTRGRGRIYFAVCYFMVVFFSMSSLTEKAEALVAAHPSNLFYGWLAAWAPSLILITGFIVLGWGFASLFRR